ncbi:MAG TPA: CDP-alcohol phosphatidyltransferase family protein, partial [Bacteroidales bacterium]|nr:CDP-alcohol phosphatidyltransferase family protein [Bacteroidales bacterium]
MKLKNNIPNLLTLINLLCGCIAIAMEFQGRYIVTITLIFIAAIFDFLDGFIARLLNAKSNIGKDLDSLSDIVSFGVLPGI